MCSVPTFAGLPVGVCLSGELEALSFWPQTCVPLVQALAGEQRGSWKCLSHLCWATGDSSTGLGGWEPARGHQSCVTGMAKLIPGSLCFLHCQPNISVLL